jgi:hypothetical protein
MDRRVWFSRRALKLHLVVLLVVPAFMALCVWQISRAVGGNSLSWAYVFEWPLFAGYAVYMWWRFVHEDPDSSAATETTVGRPTATATATASASASASAAAAPAPAAPPAPAPAPAPDELARQQDDAAELAAYNAYLAQLAERDRAAGR